MKELKARKCAEWLAYCLSIGWDKKDIPELEKLWMDSHDNFGRFFRAPASPPIPQDHCPTCGSKVRVSVDKEGSGCFLPEESQEELWTEIVVTCCKGGTPRQIIDKLGHKFTIIRSPQSMAGV